MLTPVNTLDDIVFPDIVFSEIYHTNGAIDSALIIEGNVDVLLSDDHQVGGAFIALLKTTNRYEEITFNASEFQEGWNGDDLTRAIEVRLAYQKAEGYTIAPNLYSFEKKDRQQDVLVLPEGNVLIVSQEGDNTSVEMYESLYKATSEFEFEGPSVKTTDVGKDHLPAEPGLSFISQLVLLKGNNVEITLRNGEVYLISPSGNLEHKYPEDSTPKP